MIRELILQPREIKLSYEIINRTAVFILVIYEDDFVLGSLALNSKEKLDEWLEKMKALEIPKRKE